MTNDIVINNIINDLCQRFNVAASELIPRLQAYAMAMSLYGAIVSAVFCVAIIIGAIIIVKKCYSYDKPFAIFVALLLEIFPLFVMLYSIYMYIGWKYAPEVKSIEYIMQLFNK